MGKDDTTPSEGDDGNSSDTLPSGELSLPRAEEVHVEYGASPPPLPEGKKIHPRRPTPPVPEGDEAPDESPSSPVDVTGP